MKGNGFLSPNGIFYECLYEGHCELARTLVEENNYYVDACDKMWRDKEHILKKNGYIYFGFTGDLGTNTDSYVFLDSTEDQVTDHQIKWVNENKDKLTNKQFEKFQAMVNDDKETLKAMMFKKRGD